MILWWKCMRKNKCWKLNSLTQESPPLLHLAGIEMILFIQWVSKGSLSVLAIVTSLYISIPVTDEALLLLRRLLSYLDPVQHLPQPEPGWLNLRTDCNNCSGQDLVKSIISASIMQTLLSGGSRSSALSLLQILQIFQVNNVLIFRTNYFKLFIKGHIREGFIF